MTTRNVSSSCDVLWLSRQGEPGIAAFFRGIVDPILPKNLPEAVATLIVNGGAIWLAGGQSSNPIGAYDGTAQGVGSGTNFSDWAKGINSDVISCQWSKDIDAAAGSFSLQLKPREGYGQLIKTGDLFVIFMDNDHQFVANNKNNGTLVTIGLVDTVSSSIGVDGSGATIEVVSVSGRDLGAIFQETQTLWDPAFAQIDQEWYRGAFLKGISEDRVKALAPNETVLICLDLIFNQNATKSKLVGAQWTLPTTAGKDARGRPLTILSLINVTTFTQSAMYGYALAGGLGVVQAGTVWTLIEGHANRLVNEFFFDVRDFVQAEFNTLRHLEANAKITLTDDDIDIQAAKKKEIYNSGVFNQSTLDVDLNRIYTAAPDSPPTPVPALVHRQRPWDVDTFRLLPTHDLDHTETFSYDTAYSTHQICNFFRVNFPDIQTIAQEMLYGVLYNLSSITQYGIRRCEGETRFSFPGSRVSNKYKVGQSPNRPPFYDAFEYYNELLATWNAANDLLLTGTISCRFRPEIRVGTRLRYAGVDGNTISFYVQAVQHSFGVQAGASGTMLTVVRGFNEDDPDSLPNNLSWGRIGARTVGSLIPPGLVVFGKTSPRKGLEVQDLLQERAARNRERAARENDLELRLARNAVRQTSRLEEENNEIFGPELPPDNFLSEPTE